MKNVPSNLQMFPSKGKRQFCSMHEAYYSQFEATVVVALIPGVDAVVVVDVLPAIVVDVNPRLAAAAAVELPYEVVAGWELPRLLVNVPNDWWPLWSNTC